jgi:4-diphosphocytidyl-2-C-methyl-D-erythritol kinase
VTCLQKIARAKINLALHVTGRRDDGYHLLDSLVGFAKIGDWLQFENSDQLTLTVTGPERGTLGIDPNNLVMQAALRLREFAGKSEQGASMHLEKNLPVASGVGGGSADAAATLVGLCQLWQLSIPKSELMKLALSLGADVPVCVAGTSSRVSGIGEHIEPIAIDAFNLVLVNPRLAVSTPEVFDRLARKSNPPMHGKPEDMSWISHLQVLRNDLQVAAIDGEPAIQRCLDALGNIGSCNLARMSGSGATCFGLFDTKTAAARAADLLRQAYPDWWVVETQLAH